MQHSFLCLTTSSLQVAAKLPLLQERVIIDTNDGHDQVGSHVGVELGFDNDLSLGGSEGIGVELRGTWDSVKQNFGASEFTDEGAGFRYGWVSLDNA